MPGGVSSPVRAFKGVSRKGVAGQPPFISHGHGSRIVDVDGNEYIDYVGSYGPLLLGHVHPAIKAALESAISQGTSFGAPTSAEIELAKLIKERMPVIEKVRFVNSGTEATMSALRLARAFTKRDKILKFEGCYHGHADMLLVQAGSGVATLGLPDSPGVPQSTTANTLAAPYNNLDAVSEIFKANRDQIAAVIVEPVAGNMGVVPPGPGYLEGLRELCSSYGAMLIFDEVMTGFRVAPGGAQQLYGIKPDLVCMGKVIGAGLPVGAYGGSAEIMSLIAPEGPVYQAGTLSGNPLAMNAGVAMLNELKSLDYAYLENLGEDLQNGLRDAAAEAGLAAQVNRVGSMATLFFADHRVHNYTDASRADHARFGLFFHEMLNRGIYLPPSGYEAWFLSFAHRERDINETLEAAGESMRAVA